MKNVVPESMRNHTRNNGINVPITRHAMSTRKTAVACLFVVLLHYSPHNALQAISSPFVCLTLTTYHLTRLNAVYVPCSASQTINTTYTHTHTRTYTRAWRIVHHIDPSYLIHLHLFPQHQNKTTEPQILNTKNTRKPCKYVVFRILCECPQNLLQKSVDKCLCVC